MLACSCASMAASMDVGNEIDRWRIERRREDGRPTRVAGEDGERRDVLLRTHTHIKTGWKDEAHTF